MIKMISTYLMIGVAFIIIVDWATSYSIKRGLPVPSNTDWNDSMRLVGIIIWPLGLIFFLKGYIKERYFNNKNNNK